MDPPIDWEQLAQKLDLLREGGESGGSTHALRAVELLLGEDRLRATVDYYVEGGRGSELARSVLWQLHPWSAMQRCYEIYRSNADVEGRTAAVELLRVVADVRALPWIEEFLNDPAPGIQWCGASALDQLLWSGLVFPEQCAQLLQQLSVYPNEEVRKEHAFIRDYLREREEKRE